MSSDLKTIRVLEFDGKTANWEGWSEKFLARAKRKGYKKLLLGTEKIPKGDEYELAVLGSSADDKKVKKLGESNEEAYEDIILSISHTTKQGKIAFSLVKNCKTSAYPEGNCKLAWDRLVAKYAPKTAPSLLKLKKKFANSKLHHRDDHPDEWITELESLRTEMESIHISTAMADIDFMIHILNNLPEEYDVVLDGMESRLMLDDSNPSKLTIEDIRDKLNNRFERIDERSEQEEREVALAGYYGKAFKGLCNKCGKYGHKASECRSDKTDNGKSVHNGQNGKSNIICYHCGKPGHVRNQCPSRIAGEKAELAREYEDDDESIVELGL